MQRLGGQCGVFLDHEQRHHLAGSFVGLRDGRDLQHAGMLGDDALDLVRIHVESRHQDHVLLAILDVDEALLVHAADVAGSQPVSRT